MKRNVLIAGATGKVGGEVARLLQNESDLQVIAGARSESGRASLTKAGYEVRHLDLDDEVSVEQALVGVDAALLLTGYSVDMLAQSKRFLDAARSQRVEQIVHVGASGSPTNDVVHWGWHRFVEAYIEQQGFRFTHIQPEAFMQNITGPGYRWLSDDTIHHYIDKAKWTWVDCLDVAAVAAKALSDPAQLDGQVVRLGYDAATMDEVAEHLSTVTGRRILAEGHQPAEFLEAAIEGGADPAYMNCVAKQFELDAAGKIPGAGETFDNFKRIVGREPSTWATFADRNRDLI